MTRPFESAGEVYFNELAIDFTVIARYVGDVFGAGGHIYFSSFHQFLRDILKECEVIGD